MCLFFRLSEAVLSLFAHVKNSSDFIMEIQISWSFDGLVYQTSLLSIIFFLVIFLYINNFVKGNRPFIISKAIINNWKRN